MRAKLILENLNNIYKIAHFLAFSQNLMRGIE